ncbi:MAG: DUF4340 domain-containing protein [Candidatus Poribacteria bacterium]
MNFRNTLILLIVFALLLGTFLLLRGRKPEKKEIEKNISETYAIKRDEIKQIRLSFKDENTKPFLISKDAENQWRLVEPIQAEANQDEVEALLDDLLNKRVKQTLGNETDLSKFGLDEPTVKIELWTSSEEPDKTFLIGNQAVGYSVYVKEKSSDSVITIESSALTDFSKPYTDFRDNTVIGLSLGDVKGITLSYPNQKPIICNLNPEGTWIVDVSYNGNLMKAKADKTEIGDILDALKNLKVKVFEADGVTNLSQYGLDNPRIEATVALGGNKASKTLLIGKNVPDTNRVYVKRKNSDSVFSVNRDIVKGLTKTVYDFRDKTVIDFQRTDVNKFELKRGDKIVVCEKDDLGEWRITQPAEYKADKHAIDNLLFELDSLKARKFVSDKPASLAPYGLDKPQNTVTLYESGETEPKVLLFGKKQGNSVHVKTEATDTVFLVKGNLLDEVNVGVAELRDKIVLKFDSDDAQKLELKHDDVAITCVKQGVNWRITIPSNEDADNDEVTGILNKLAELRVEKFVSDKPDVATVGLDKPQVQVTVTLKDNTAYKLLIGKSAGNGTVYAKLEAPEELFLLNDAIVESLKKTLDDLRKK